ncbi:hypothetical protein EG327_003632 [Venturia inaequalis]|uniref:Peptidase A1 domain-containing protein n=1 Tax=Venturia inaequalis TaxID=5025 RepID=A0A8H3VHJ5_VENIN|nr:hypothetical protein EG327_003632 [Venturia inaequalis]
MVASDVASTTTSTFVTVVTISFSTPTGSSVEALPKSSSNNDKLLVGLASAGGFVLFLFVVGLLFCLKHTRTKHRRRIEDMEYRLKGLENQTRPPPAPQAKRFSTATGTSLGSSWGAWRSKDVNNFQKLRTANQTKKSDKRKSFAHGWWSFSPSTRNQDHHQNITPLQDVTSFRAANPPQPINASENDMEPLMTPRLSAIIECPSPSQAPAPARPDPPAVKASHRDSAATQTHANGLCDDKEIQVTSEIVTGPTPKNDMSFIDKEVAVSNGTGLKKNTAENRPAPPPPPPPPPSKPSKTHQRKPALAGAISVFPPGTLTGADTLHPTSTRYRPFSVINEDPLAAPRRPVPPPPPTRKAIANRPSRSYSHIRNQSAFSDDSRSSMENSVAGRMSAQSNHARSGSAQSNTIWPWDIHSPQVDYGSASDPLPRFKQHRSPKAVAEEFQNRLQNLTTSELDVSTAARIESTDPRAADIADSYRTLVEKEERPEPVASRKSINKNSSHKPTNGSVGKRRSSRAPPSTSAHENLILTSPVSSCPSSTRSSQGNPFHYGESSDRLTSFHTTSTSYLKRPIPGPREGTDPVLNVARPTSNSSTISTRREAGDKKSRAANESSPDLNIAIPTPALHYPASTFGTPNMQPLPRCQYVRKVEPILEQDEPMRSAKPVFKHPDWDRSSNIHLGIDPSRSCELVSPSNDPSRTRSVEKRKSRDKDEKTYNILNRSPLSGESFFKKKNSLMGASETFSIAKDKSPTGSFFSRRSNSDSSRTTKNSLMGSQEEFPSYADCSGKGTACIKSDREDDNCTNPRVRELKNPRRSGLRSPLSPYSISEDEAVDQTSPKAYSPLSATSASPARRSSYDLRRHLSLKSLGSPVIPSPCLSDTTPSEIDARETNKLLLQSFPAPTLPPASVSSSQNPFASPDSSSTTSSVSTRDATSSIRQGFGPGPSLSLLERWEKQGRSYITNHTAIPEEDDRGIQTFARGKAPRNPSPALGSSEQTKTSGADTTIHHHPPPPESTKKKPKHTRWESRGEIAEIISPPNSSLQKCIKPQASFHAKPQVLPASHQREVCKPSITNTQTDHNTTTTLPTTSSMWPSFSKSPLKPLLKPSESARRAEAVGMKKSIDYSSVPAPENGGSSTGEGSQGGYTGRKGGAPRGLSPPRKRGPKPTLEAAGVSEPYYTPLVNQSTRGFWEFASKTATVNGKTIQRENQQSGGNSAIADTGTTLALVDDTLCKAIYGAIPGAKYDEQQQGWTFPSNTTAANLPVVEFDVGGKLFTVQKEDLLFAETEPGTTYGGIQSRGTQTFDILGDTFLKGIYAIFDMGNKQFGAVQRTETTQNLATAPETSS